MKEKEKQLYELKGKKRSGKEDSVNEINEIKGIKNGTKKEEKYMTSIEPKFEDPSDNLLYRINNYALLVNKLDYYGNAIPLGAFCYAISFILYGFLECKVHKKEDKFLYLILLLFGGFGQIIAGLLEYIKGRTFPSNLYLIFGIYFICFYYVNHYKKVIFTDDCRGVFYATWAIIAFPIFIGSSRTNFWYLIQTFFACAFFVVRCIGEWINVTALKEVTSGVLELVTGFISLYICFYQLINETFRFQVLPAFPLQQDNEIDINKEINHYN